MSDLDRLYGLPVHEFGGRLYVLSVGAHEPNMLDRLVRDYEFSEARAQDPFWPFLWMPSPIVTSDAFRLSSVVWDGPSGHRGPPTLLERLKRAILRLWRRRP